MPVSVFGVFKIGAVILGLMGETPEGVDIESIPGKVAAVRETGADMKDRYKETARGGLALNVIEGPLDVSVNLPEC